MTVLKFQAFFWLFIIFTPLLSAQEKGPYVPSFKFKDGLYLSLEEFKTNNPSIPLDKNQIVDIGNGSVIRMNRFEYGPEEENESISSNKVLFVCMDGKAFINHRCCTKLQIDS